MIAISPSARWMPPRAPALRTPMSASTLGSAPHRHVRPSDHADPYHDRVPRRRSRDGGRSVGVRRQPLVRQTRWFASRTGGQAGKANTFGKRSRLSLASCDVVADGSWETPIEMDRSRKAWTTSSTCRCAATRRCCHQEEGERYTRSTSARRTITSRRPTGRTSSRHFTACSPSSTSARCPRIASPMARLLSRGSRVADTGGRSSSVRRSLTTCQGGDEAIAQTRAKPVDPGRYDVVFDGASMWGR